MARPGEVLIPGKADDPVKYMDVRDVSYWMIRLIEQKKLELIMLLVLHLKPVGMLLFMVLTPHLILLLNSLQFLTISF